jgi:hypothetical protein
MEMINNDVFNPYFTYAIVVVVLKSPFLNVKESLLK